ncbi:hypothetical protein VTN31DRAFT_6526 [Thermomyces dupontii]|uniref:uncharacterized protein n=1 Tax=Talaromyces thermophilus TaxID=28565 RepID=UPI0037434367
MLKCSLGTLTAGWLVAEDWARCLVMLDSTLGNALPLSMEAGVAGGIGSDMVGAVVDCSVWARSRLFFRCVRPAARSLPLFVLSFEFDAVLWKSMSMLAGQYHEQEKAMHTFMSASGLSTNISRGVVSKTRFAIAL